MMGPLLNPHHATSTTTELCNENLTQEQTKASTQTFKTFVESTVQGLIETENDRRRDSSSSLAVFCRVDVAVCQPKRGGPFFYYVNEVERSLTVGLFRGMSSDAAYWSALHDAIALMPGYILNSRAGAMRGGR